MDTASHHITDMIVKLATDIYKPTSTKVMEALIADGHDPLIAQSYLEDIVFSGKVRVDAALRLSIR